MDFIINNEGYDRSFYAGFLGELNFDFETKENTTDLYVNLRCMQVKENLAHIYVGGGITIDSNAEIEWLETVNKSQTIKKILL
jgi:isochorismate synthase